MLQINHNYSIPSAVATVGVIVLVAACGGSDGGGGVGSTGVNVVPDQPCTDCATPPAARAVGVPGDGDGAVLAVSKLYLGDADRNGSRSSTAWREFGYDLDGYKSTKTSKTHCQFNEGGASKSEVQTDGENGIDNSFGSNILPLIVGIQSDATTQMNESLDAGASTVIIQIDGVGSGRDYVNLPAALYAGADLGSAPTWTGTDEWPVLCELMTNCEEAGTLQFPDNKSKVQFPSSYIADGTWVSGSKSTVNLSLSIGGYPISIDINQAVITAKLSGSPPTSASEGVIAGIIESAKLIESLRMVAGLVNTSLCEGPLFDGVAQRIMAASDIMKDGTQNKDAHCDGISIGIGFDMMAVKLGAVKDVTPAGIDPCPAP